MFLVQPGKGVGQPPKPSGAVGNSSGQVQKSLGEHAKVFGQPEKCLGAEAKPSRLERKSLGEVGKPARASFIKLFPAVRFWRMFLKNLIAGLVLNRYVLTIVLRLPLIFHRLFFVIRPGYF